jgi:hypothetical protein
MPYFKFKRTSTIVAYFPLLIKKEWWLGYKDPNDGNVHLLPDPGHELQETYKNLLIAESDIEAQKERL